MNGFIYTLSDPRTGSIRYVGQTVRKPNRRFIEHLNKNRLKRNTYKNNWLNELLQISLLPIMDILIEAPVEYLNDLETYWLDYFKVNGSPLTNVYFTAGNPPERNMYVVKEHSGRFKKGHQMSEDARQKQLAAVKGNSFCKGFKHSDETKKNMSLALIGKKQSKELVAKRTAKVVKEWIIIYPDGKREDIVNLHRFCIENNLESSCMRRVALGKYSNHKGFKCERKIKSNVSSEI